MPRSLLLLGWLPGLCLERAHSVRTGRVPSQAPVVLSAFHWILNPPNPQICTLTTMELLSLSLTLKLSRDGMALPMLAAPRCVCVYEA